MKWIKKGLVYEPDGNSTWAKHSALQPTPYLIDDVIRVFVGFRDDQGVSRVGFVDVAADNPSEVLNRAQRPALDIGIPGTFDENGVVPCAVSERDGKLYLYYAGYQLGQKVKFCVFAGLAISADKGDTFTRYSKAPILDRTDRELFFRVIHSIRFEDGVWKTWYGAGSEFLNEDSKQFPKYNIRYIESSDGIHFDREGFKICVDMKGEDEYRVGRPYVIKDGHIYKMFYCAGTKSKGYRMGYAESKDGITWERMDENVGLDVSAEGWDSQMIAYPGIIKYKDKVYMFYNGNNYGEAGFGYAVLDR